ncbi:MAG: hypothetical protein JRJ15_02090 [Deltaproteobacteria bacterium]|nr:hypothetical protein [Deltaproteobacteria bacterium]
MADLTKMNTSGFSKLLSHPDFRTGTICLNRIEKYFSESPAILGGE